MKSDRWPAIAIGVSIAGLLMMSLIGKMEHEAMAGRLPNAIEESLKPRTWESGICALLLLLLGVGLGGLGKRPAKPAGVREYSILVVWIPTAIMVAQCAEGRVRHYDGAPEWANTWVLMTVLMIVLSGVAAGRVWRRVASEQARPEPAPTSREG
jgi:hypothetical protein